MRNLSWKTTLCGILALIGVGLVQVDFGPFWMKLGALLSSVATGAGLLFTRDNDKSSEQVGAGNTGAHGREAVPIPKVGPSLLLLSVVSALALGGGGCKTSDPEGRILASTAQTVDAAMQGWAMWVAQGKADVYTESRVRAAYGQYQLAFDAAQSAYTVWRQTGEKNAWEKAAITLRTMREKLLNLVDVFQTKPAAGPPLPVP